MVAVEATIRAAERTDIAAVLQLWIDADAEATHTDDAPSLDRLIAHDPAALLVAELDGRLVGSVVAGWDGWRGSIYRLAVAPDQRRRGLGRRLVAAAEERFGFVGAVRMHAIVVETDSQAAGFWRSSGWVQQAERLRFVKG